MQVENGASTVQGLRSRFSSWPNWAVGVGCVAVILIAVERGYEGAFYPIGMMMHQPSKMNAAFGYRILLPFLAAQLQKLVPSLTDHNCFIATQIVAIVSVVMLSGGWASLFMPKLGRIFGYAFVTLMICPTIDYWNFYDIALVGFWTACLLLLYYDRLAVYVAILALGTLNHENTLLLIPCALVYYWNRLKVWQLTLFAFAQIAAWTGVRYWVISSMQGGALFDNRIWDNLFFWRFYHMQSIFFACIAVVPWWAVACKGWKYSSSLLRCCARSLPGLYLVTFLFGKFDEARQFDAFIPVCMGFIACWLRSELWPAPDASSGFCS
jgi:hypothetical protein